jgi:hypothetical protein
VEGYREGEEAGLSDKDCVVKDSYNGVLTYASVTPVGREETFMFALHDLGLTDPSLTFPHLPSIPIPHTSHLA